MVNYLISRVGDPIFALLIGASAAAVRVRREETEQGHTGTDTWEALKRRAEYYVGKVKGGETGGTTAAATSKQ
ncbi:hypothetical protein EDC01DRAFT_660848 [Geopyxis carbonaria]|nr:hypothetical protein EDC01DRAFT_660848 [Geopyxis carbonaria]